MTKLTVKSREGKKSSELTRMRFEGDIPAVFYSAGKEAVHLRVNGSEFRTVMRNLKPGHLPTTIFEMEIGGKKERAIIREIQYKPTTYDVMHLDFYKLDESRKVTLNVPIECEGVADSVGIKLGGVLRKVKRHVRVRCLPGLNIMPKEFVVDVRHLSMNQSIRVSELKVMDGVQVLLNADDVLVVIAKK